MGPGPKPEIWFNTGARVGMRFIERSLRARDTFRYSPVGAANIPKSRELASEGESGLPVVEQRPRLTVVFIELGRSASGANVKITTAERLAGL